MKNIFNLFKPSNKKEERKLFRENYVGQDIFLCNDFWSPDGDTMQLFGESMKPVLKPGMHIVINGQKLEILEVFGSSEYGQEDKPTEFADPLVPETPIIVSIKDTDWETVRNEKKNYPGELIPFTLTD